LDQKVTEVTEEAFSSQKRGLPTLQNINLKKNILPLWVIFALLRLLDQDPDTLTRLNPDPILIRNPGPYYLTLSVGALKHRQVPVGTILPDLPT
jgi:hypothetical protein